jgi:hypothetical protein
MNRIKKEKHEHLIYVDEAADKMQHPFKHIYIFFGGTRV